MTTGHDDRTGTLRHELRVLRALAREMITATERAAAALERALEERLCGTLQDPLQGVGSADPLPPPDPHVARHRPGQPSKIEADPELRAFVIARPRTG